MKIPIVAALPPPPSPMQMLHRCQFCSECLARGEADRPSQSLSEEGFAFNACQLSSISEEWEIGVDSEKCIEFAGYWPPPQVDPSLYKCHFQHEIQYWRDTDTILGTTPLLPWCFIELHNHGLNVGVGKKTHVFSCLQEFTKEGHPWRKASWAEAVARTKVTSYHCLHSIANRMLFVCSLLLKNLETSVLFLITAWMTAGFRIKSLVWDFYTNMTF